MKGMQNKGHKWYGQTEAEAVKKRWQEYTEELFKEDLNDPDNHDGVISHPQPDIMECEIKWALGSITMNKASEGDGIPIELFQILKDDAVKVLCSICQQIWKTQQWPQDWKRSVFIPIPKKGNAKECSNYHTIALISHGSKVMLKIFQARLQQYINCELPDVQAWFRKGLKIFIFLGFKITADGDCSHEIKGHLCLGRKAMTKLDSIIKSRDITLPMKGYLVKAVVFPVVMYGCESCTIKKVESQKIDASVLKKTLESPLDSKETKPVKPKGKQS